MKKLKVIFMGTPLFSVPILEMLIEKTNVIGVVTQPDKKVGRHQDVKYSPIKQLALKHNINVFTPVKIRVDFKDIIALNPDIIITCAYGQIIPKEILSCPLLGCINVHASLLPCLRGGAPIHHAIMDGYEETGITIMYMDEQMDSGDIISQEKIKISSDDNVGTLHDKLSIIGRDLLLKTLPSIIDKTNKREKQDLNKVTFGFNIKREEELIDFNNSSISIFNKVRGLYPWPLAYFILNDQETKVLECKVIDEKSSKKPGDIIKADKNGLLIKALDNAVLITKIKPYGKKEMLFGDYYNGLKDKTGIVIKNVL